MYKHVPKHSRHSPHDGNASDLGATTQLDPSVPSFHLVIVLEEVKHELSQDESGDLAAFLGDGAKPVLIVTGISTTRCESKVVR